MHMMRRQMETFSALLAYCAGRPPHKGQWRGALMFSLICNSTVFQQQTMKKIINAQHYWTLCEANPLVTGEFPSQKASNGGKSPCHGVVLSLFWQGWMTHIRISKRTIIGSDNGLAPARRQAIIWTNAGILLITPLGTNFSEILIEIYIFSFKKMHWKMSSGKWRPFCLGLNVLTPPLHYG